MILSFVRVLIVNSLYGQTDKSRELRDLVKTQKEDNSDEDSDPEENEEQQVHEQMLRKKELSTQILKDNIGIIGKCIHEFWHNNTSELRRVIMQRRYHMQQTKGMKNNLAA